MSIWRFVLMLITTKAKKVSHLDLDLLCELYWGLAKTPKPNQTYWPNHSLSLYVLRTSHQLSFFDCTRPCEWSPSPWTNKQVNIIIYDYFMMIKCYNLKMWLTTYLLSFILLQPKMMSNIQVSNFEEMLKDATSFCADLTAWDLTIEQATSLARPYFPGT